MFLLDDDGDTDNYAFLDDLEEEDIKGEMEFEEDELTAQQVESWSLIELEEYLLTFSITEEETTWLQVSTKNIPCDTELSVMPYFKEIIKKRLTGCCIKICA